MEYCWNVGGSMYKIDDGDHCHPSGSYEGWTTVSCESDSEDIGGLGCTYSLRWTTQGGYTKSGVGSHGLETCISAEAADPMCDQYFPGGTFEGGIYPGCHAGDVYEDL